MFQVIDILGYPDYSCLFCMKHIVICAITTSSFVSRNGIRRDSARYVLSCMKLILQLKTLAVSWLVLLQSRNPHCRFHASIFPFLFLIVICSEEESRQITSDLSASGWVAFPLHRHIIDFTEGVDCILFQTVNDMEISLCHLYGGVSEEA